MQSQRNLYITHEREYSVLPVKCQDALKLGLTLSCQSSLCRPLPVSRKQGFGMIWGSSSSKESSSLHWIWWCRARLRLPKHSNIVYLRPQRDFSMTHDITIKKENIQVPEISLVSPNCSKLKSSFHFPLLMGSIFFGFCLGIVVKISLQLNSQFQHVTCHSRSANSLFCQLHHAVAMMCLPCRPDNVVTSWNPTAYWMVWGSSSQRPCVLVHSEWFPPGNS